MQHKQPSDAGELGNIDLTPKQHLEVTRLLKQHVPKTLVWAHGSRVTFKSQERHASDLDLVVFSTKMQASDVYNLRESLEDSDLPFSVDVLVWREIPDRFRARMKQAYYVLQEDKGSNRPLGWKTVTLGEVANIGTGKSNSQDAEIEGQYLFFDRSVKVKRSKKFLFDCQAVIVPGEGKEFVPRYSSGKFDLHQRAYCITVKRQQELDTKFLYYQLLFKRAYWQRVAVGSTVKSLRLNSFTSFPIALPNIGTQRVIARILGSLDDKIEVNRKMNQTLEDIAKALFKSWFVDFDPVRAKMALKAHSQSASSTPSTEAERNVVGDKAWSVELAQAYLDQLDPSIAAMFPDELVDSELGEIPKGWVLASIDKACEKIYSGGTPSTKTPEYWDGIHGWLSSGETGSTFIIDTEKKITEAGIENSSTKAALRFDTVIASAGQGKTRGQTSLLLLDTYVNQSVVTLRAKTEVGAFLLFFNLARRYEEFRRYSDSSSSRGSLTSTLLKELPFVIPSEGPTTRFHKATYPIVEKIEINLKKNQVLSELRDTLLPKLISGELRIPDAEKLLEEVGV